MTPTPTPTTFKITLRHRSLAVRLYRTTGSAPVLWREETGLSARDCLTVLRSLRETMSWSGWRCYVLLKGQIVDRWHGAGGYGSDPLVMSVLDRLVEDGGVELLSVRR